MNPFLNPINSILFLKNYISDNRRLDTFLPKKMKKFRDKSFRKIVKYAFTVPLYHDKYKNAGIHPSDINGIEDIKKLPMISKDDLIDGFPDQITPINYNLYNAEVHCTGGTTGKPVYIYYDFNLCARTTIFGVRDVGYLGLNWRKSKFAYIGEFIPNRTASTYTKIFLSHARAFNSLSNLYYIDINTPIDKIMNELESFNPDTIHSDPVVLQQLAFLKNKGFGKKLEPKVLTVGGSMLDSYTRCYIENVFGCQVLNLYSSVEAGGSIAFECLNNTWHINHDFYELEAVDRAGEIVSPGEEGKIVLTRLFGTGTPIIRYTGMNDLIISPIYEKCDCGLFTPILKDGIKGRSRADIILPNGKIFSAASFCAITPVTQQLKTYKIKQYQIIQKKIDEIEILVVIYEDLRNVGPSVSDLFKEILKVYKKLVGPSVRVTIKEVEQIKSECSYKPPPIVVSHVKIEDFL